MPQYRPALQLVRFSSSSAVCLCVCRWSPAGHGQLCKNRAQQQRPAGQWQWTPRTTCRFALLSRSPLLPTTHNATALCSWPVILAIRASIVEGTSLITVIKIFYQKEIWVLSEALYLQCEWTDKWDVKCMYIHTASFFFFSSLLCTRFAHLCWACWDL